MALPQFGLFSNVRVCSDCFNKSPRLKTEDSPSSIDSIDAATNDISKLSLSIDDKIISEVATEKALLPPLDCNCGMPLCICEAPKPASAPTEALRTTVSVQSASKSKKNSSILSAVERASTNKGSSFNMNSRILFNHHRTNTDYTSNGNTKYEVTGEGLREAIKNDDTVAVKRLLSEGVDANYCDKQGLSLLHLAALFNRTEIAFVLLDYGANPERRNAQGETPIDCAPTMLQHKMREKIREGMP